MGQVYDLAGVGLQMPQAKSYGLGPGVSLAELQFEMIITQNAGVFNLDRAGYKGWLPVALAKGAQALQPAHGRGPHLGQRQFSIYFKRFSARKIGHSLSRQKRQFFGEAGQGLGGQGGGGGHGVPAVGC